jgi:glycosyltransferase involved in cell wall biosynthesis
MIRIVYVITGLGIGGAEVNLLRLLSAIDKKRFKPVVVSLGDLGEIGKRIQEIGIPVHAVGIKSILSGMPGFIRLVRIIRKCSPNLVHTLMPHADLLGGMVAKWVVKSSIVWTIVQVNLDRDFNKSRTLKIIKLCAKLSRIIPDIIVSNSHKAALIHQQAGYVAQKFTIIYNGIDLNMFRPNDLTRAEVRREMQVADDALVIGLIARFHPVKGHRVFVEAAGLLRKKFTNVHFFLNGLGVNKQNSELNEWIHKEKLEQSFHFMGMHLDVSKMLSALDILVSSSYGESFSNIIGEAMACGVPCVVTDVGDSAIIVGDTGRVAAPGDPLELAKVMEELLRMPDEERRRLGTMARKHIEEKFSMEKTTRQYEHLYMQLAKH